MASNEDMVPTGLPYGERQKTKAAMKAAGIPASSASGGGSPPTAQPTAAPPAAPAPAAPAPVSRQALAEYDVFANREPTEDFQALPQRQVMYEQVRQSDNAVMQAIFSRMAGYKEG